MGDKQAADVNRLSAGERLGTLWSRSVSGGAFTLVSKVIRLAMIIASYAALGRLLTPEEFGLVNMITPILFFTMIFSDMGFSMSIVQRKDISAYEISALFWLSMATGVAFSIVCAGIMTPAFAYFVYDEPRILVLAWVLSLEIFLFAIRSQYNALLLRDLRFHSIAVIQLAASVMATIVAISCAFGGFGAWALVLMRLSQGVFEAVFYFASKRWVPQFVSLRDVPWDMIKFGANLTGYRVADFGNRSLNNILIGAVHGALLLGPFAVASRLMRLPVDEFSGALSRICTSALSRLQDDVREFETYYCRILFIICLIGAPAITFAAILAKPLVVLFLGETWAGAAPLFSLLAMASLSQLLVSTVGWVQIATGRSDRIFKWSVYMLPATILSFVIGFSWGPSGVAAAYGAIVLASTLPAFRYALHGSPVSLGAAWRAVMPGLGVAVVEGLALLGYVTLWPGFALSTPGLFAGLAGAAVVSAGAAYVLIGRDTIVRSFSEVRGWITSGA